MKPNTNQGQVKGSLPLLTFSADIPENSSIHLLTVMYPPRINSLWTSAILTNPTTFETPDGGGLMGLDMLLLNAKCLKPFSILVIFVCRYREDYRSDLQRTNSIASPERLNPTAYSYTNHEVSFIICESIKYGIVIKEASAKETTNVKQLNMKENEVGINTEQACKADRRRVPNRIPNPEDKTAMSRTRDTVLENSADLGLCLTRMLTGVELWITKGILKTEINSLRLCQLLCLKNIQYNSDGRKNDYGPKSIRNSDP
ncbi:hypothetical protein F2Q69_00051345 [Brassica cretica]|uniref:Uncharacterized protein n=1 Tax=Brassica cretica TaxID=69181 RepID=A0A8S9PPS6_BRACR|nr:hypothetical protein F2Q69_00051345 [Brassica cretica]